MSFQTGAELRHCECVTGRQAPVGLHRPTPSGCAPPQTPGRAGHATASDDPGSARGRRHPAGIPCTRSHVAGGAAGAGYLEREALGQGGSHRNSPIECNAKSRSVLAQGYASVIFAVAPVALMLSTIAAIVLGMNCDESPTTVRASDAPSVAALNAPDDLTKVVWTLSDQPP